MPLFYKETFFFSIQFSSLLLYLIPYSHWYKPLQEHVTCYFLEHILSLFYFILCEYKMSQRCYVLKSKLSKITYPWPTDQTHKGSIIKLPCSELARDLESWIIFRYVCKKKIVAIFQTDSSRKSFWSDNFYDGTFFWLAVLLFFIIIILTRWPFSVAENVFLRPLRSHLR